MLLLTSVVNGDEAPPNPLPPSPNPAALDALLRHVDAELHLLQTETDDAAARGHEARFDVLLLELRFGATIASRTRTPANP